MCNPFRALAVAVVFLTPNVSLSATANAFAEILVAASLESEDADPFDLGISYSASVAPCDFDNNCKEAGGAGNGSASAEFSSIPLQGEDVVDRPIFGPTDIFGDPFLDVLRVSMEASATASPAGDYRAEVGYHRSTLSFDNPSDTDVTLNLQLLGLLDVETVAPVNPGTVSAFSEIILCEGTLAIGCTTFWSERLFLRDETDFKTYDPPVEEEFRSLSLLAKSKTTVLVDMRVEAIAVEEDPSKVPVPAALPLLLSAFLILMGLRRRHS